MDDIAKVTKIWTRLQNTKILNTMTARMYIAILKFKPLSPLKKGLDSIEINNPRLAIFLCKLIPSQCPFERDLSFFGHILFHIPPMCKLNPLYNELIHLRFRALCYLADVCGEDITSYC